MEREEIIRYIEDEINPLVEVKEKKSPIWDNKDEVMRLVKMDGSVLQYASYDLQNDPEVVLAAYSNNPDSLQFASEELRKDFYFIEPLIRYNAKVLDYVVPTISNLRVLVIEAIKKDGYAIFSPNAQKFINDRDIVLLAVKSQYRVYAYLSEQMQNDPEIKEIVSECIKTKEGQNSTSVSDVKVSSGSEDTTSVSDVKVSSGSEDTTSVSDVKVPSGSAGTTSVSETNSRSSQIGLQEFRDLLAKIQRENEMKEDLLAQINNAVARKDELNNLLSELLHSYGGK